MGDNFFGKILRQIIYILIIGMFAAILYGGYELYLYIKTKDSTQHIEYKKLINEIEDLKQQNSQLPSPNPKIGMVDNEARPLSSCQNAITQILAAANLKFAVFNGQDFTHEISIMENLNTDNFVHKNLEKMKSLSNGVDSLSNLYYDFTHINWVPSSMMNDEKLIDKIFKFNNVNEEKKEEAKYFLQIEEAIAAGNLKRSIELMKKASEIEKAENEVLLNFIHRIENMMLAQTAADSIFNYMSYINYPKN